MAIMIGSLDQGNPLHLHANDSNCAFIVADYVASAHLLEQWDRCNAVVLNWILSSLSQDAYLVHVFSDNAASMWNKLKEYDRIDGPIRSSLLTREILPEVKDAFVIISREESYRGIPSSSVKTEKP
ncbi:hypothetical protein Tco_0558429 [Tanacetum coccineum]